MSGFPRNSLFVSEKTDGSLGPRWRHTNDVMVSCPTRRLQTTSTLFCVVFYSHASLVYDAKACMLNTNALGFSQSFVFHPFEDSTRILCDSRAVYVWLMWISSMKDTFFIEWHRKTHSKDTHFLYILTIVVVFCLACPVFRDIHCLFVRLSEKTDGSLGQRWRHTDDVMLSCPNTSDLKQQTSTANLHGRHFFWNDTGHDCDVADSPRIWYMDLVSRSCFIHSKTDCYSCVLHSYFIPTRLWYTVKNNSFVLGI